MAHSVVQASLEQTAVLVPQLRSLESQHPFLRTSFSLEFLNKAFMNSRCILSVKRKSVCYHMAKQGISGLVSL